MRLLSLCRRGRGGEGEVAVDDRVTFLTLAIFVDHTVNGLDPFVGAGQGPGLGEINRIDDCDLVLEMILVDHVDSLDEVGLRTEVGDQLHVLDTAEGHYMRATGAKR